ncbi:type III secretion system actin-recruiting effector Tarp [Chlamydia abortus]|uniref:type III secretion system actin-recruiting effector Tarp n=1 Tax=Chlamydia abortus TaxID=83555 RepID=UPI001116C9F4|nr:type III secretion system actin-recruiting effector Tarp [Chlamydia abortus]
MSSPINNQPITNVTTTTTTTPVVTTSTSFGGHVVSTTGTEAAETTSQTVNTTAEQAVSQAESDAGAVVFTTERSVSTTSPSTGSVGTTATAANLLGSQILGLGRSRTDSTSSSDSDALSDISSTPSSQDSGDVGSTENLTSTSGDVDLRDLEGLRGTEAADGAARPDGPGGLPDMALPKYDPTDKASIIKFLSTPSVQAKLQTKAGHIVYMDEARGSFIFVRNGDWSTAESIAVTNGKTKEPITDVKDLEMCIAKFCVGYETMHADWTNNIQPRIAGQTGETGHYDHLLMSMKFKTTVLYGPWNSKESSSNHTPSVWRRGTKCESGAIWGDVGGLKGINWNNIQRPNEGTVFSRETSSPTQQQPQPVPYAQPVINVNLGGISTSVNVTGGTTTTTVTSTTTQPTDTSDNGVDNDQNVDEANLDDTEIESTGTQEDHSIQFSDEGYGFDSLEPVPPAPPGPPPPTQGGVNITGMPKDSLQQVLQNVRQHLDTVYDQNGEHHEGNQDLGTVVRTSENGTYKPTVLLNKDQGSGGRGVQRRESNDNEDSELGNILGRVREHLDVVYPEGGNGEAIPVNQNLGEVIRDVEAGKTPKPTQPEGIFVAKRVNVDANGEIVNNNSKTETGSRTNTRIETGSRTSNLMGATSGNGPEGLEHLLPQLRAHLDESFDAQGNLITPQKTNVGKLIKAFQERTGSGGIVAPMPGQSTVIASRPVQQQSATISVLPQAQTAETVAPREAPDLLGAARDVASSLSNLLEAATPSAGRQVSTPAPQQQVASSTPVAGSRETATLTKGEAPSGIPEAAGNVTQALSNVAKKIQMFEQGSRLLQEALDSADTESTQGKQLADAARNVTSQLSKTLSKATGSPPPPPQWRS